MENIHQIPPCRDQGILQIRQKDCESQGMEVTKDPGLSKQIRAETYEHIQRLAGVARHTCWQPLSGQDYSILYTLVLRGEVHINLHP